MRPIRQGVTAVVVLAWGATAGCTPTPAKEPEVHNPSGQTYTEAIEVMCNVDTLAELDPDEDPIGIEQARTDFLYENVNHPDGIYLRTLISVKPGDVKAEMLRTQATKVGLPVCAMADTFEAEADDDLP